MAYNSNNQSRYHSSDTHVFFPRQLFFPRNLLRIRHSSQDARGPLDPDRNHFFLHLRFTHVLLPCAGSHWVLPPGGDGLWPARGRLALCASPGRAPPGLRRAAGRRLDQRRSGPNRPDMPDFSPPFCGSNTSSHFFSDIPPSLKLTPLCRHLC